MLEFFRSLLLGATVTDETSSESEDPPIVKKKKLESVRPSSTTTRQELLLDYSRLSSQKAWLNDDCIDGYLTRLAMENPDFGFLSALTVTKDNLAKFLNVKRNLPKIEAFKQKKKIAFAMVLESHWYAVMIDLDKKYISCVDGFNNQARHEECFERARMLLAKIDAADYETKSLVIPTQNNASDCGVVACYYIQCFAKNELEQQLSSDNAEHTERDYGFFRQSIRDALQPLSTGEASTSTLPSGATKRKRGH